MHALFVFLVFIFSTFCTPSVSRPLEEVFKRRLSVREFLPDREVPAELVHDILDIVRETVPTAGNVQAYRVVVVTDDDVHKRLTAACNFQTGVSTAPVNLVFLADKKRGASKYGDRGIAFSTVDTANAIMMTILSATDKGLGSLYVGGIMPDEVRKAIEAPDYLDVVAVVSLGYPAKQTLPADRLPFEQIVSYNKFSTGGDNKDL